MEQKLAGQCFPTNFKIRGNGPEFENKELSDIMDVSFIF